MTQKGFQFGDKYFWHALTARFGILWGRLRWISRPVHHSRNVNDGVVHAPDPRMCGRRATLPEPE
jgi:hypothetical protein